jgi:hypothetical protein
MASSVALFQGEVSHYSHEMGGEESFALEKTPFLTDRVGKEVIASLPKEGTPKICEIIHFATGMFAVPRMVVGLQNAILGKPDVAGMQGLGLTSIFSVYTGTVTGQRGYAEYTEASQINDTAGQVIGATNMARSPMEIMGGLTFTSFRVLSIAATYTSSKVIVTAQFIFGTLGSAFFALTYAFLTIPSVMTLYKNISFSSKLNEAMGKGESPYAKAKFGLLTLVEEWKGTEEEKKAFLEKVAKDPKMEGKGVDPSLLTDDERSFLLQEAMKYKPSDPFKRSILYEHFQEEFVKFKKEKEAEFIRKTGPKAAAWMKEELAKPVEEQLLHKVDCRQGIDQAKEVLKNIEKEAWKNCLLHVGIVVTCVIGATALVAGSIFTGGAPVIIIAVAWVIASMGTLAIDGYFLYETLKEGEMDRNDKILFFVVNVLLILVAGAGVFFSGGLAPLIIGSVMLVLWIGVAAYSYYKWRSHPVELLPESS